MNVTGFEKNENNEAVLTVAVDAPAFDKALDSVYKKMRGDIAVPGFRRGKAPRKIIENLYGASTFYNDALDDLLPDVCAFGIMDKELTTVGYPKIDKVEVQEDKSVIVEFSIGLYPVIEIGEYKGLHAVKPPIVVPDSAIDSEIETIRLRNATVEAVERPAINGDTVLIDYSGSVDGVLFDGGTAEGYELTLGSNSFIPGFEAQVQGMVKDEERDINVTFPEEYHSDELAGKAAIFKVKVHEVRSKILPEADDEFAKDVSEFDTLDEYKADIRARLEKDREADADNFFENGLLEKLAESVTGGIPEVMFEEQVESQVNNFRNQLQQYGMDLGSYLNMMGSSEEAFKADARPAAEKQVRTSLALTKIAEIEAFEIANEDVEKLYSELAEQYSVDMEVVRASMDPADVKRELQLRAAVKLVREHGIADDPPAVDETEAVVDEVVEAAVAEEKPKAKRAPAKKKAESTDETDAGESAEKPKKAPAKKAATEKKTTAKKAEETKE